MNILGLIGTCKSLSSRLIIGRLIRTILEDGYRARDTLNQDVILILHTPMAPQPRLFLNGRTNKMMKGWIGPLSTVGCRWIFIIPPCGDRFIQRSVYTYMVVCPVRISPISCDKSMELFSSTLSYSLPFWQKGAHLYSIIFLKNHIYTLWD